ncbi:glycosyltransferase family 4 protein [Aestuariirhabdus sp. LZHN29]|uniref:glycosyltransferase family 4 protein n=1 Tax=Aestuariirhabdus sp. LZHN29 TaxID=3417462 RepID=UPI003CF11CA4
MSQRVAFYAPMKSPNYPTPSGDQRIARLFMGALAEAGYSVELASELRCWEGQGERLQQGMIRQKAQAECERLINDYGSLPKGQRPDYWFTYHLYHKAPDWIGPAVSKALGIPYVIAEASIANKQRDGSWSAGWQQSRVALGQAAAVVTLNPRDEPALHDCVLRERIHHLTPFLEYAPPPLSSRAVVADQFGMDPQATWLVTSAMMRPGDKLASYERLSCSLSGLSGQNWQLLVIGDGKEREAVEALFADKSDRVFFAGELSMNEIQHCLPACDLFVWPAVNEAIGMAMLEALNAGVPVLSGYSPALYPLSLQSPALTMLNGNDASSFEKELGGMLNSPGMIRHAAESCHRLIRENCSLSAAAVRLRGILEPLL